jgi:phosphoribosylformylglycinamidine synthase subunit PurS
VKFAANINVMPKQEISDPQGQAVERTLPSLGFDSVDEVRIGKRIEIVLEAADQAAAEAIAVAMCDKMLANPVIEDYELEVITVGGTPPDDPLKASGSLPAANSEGAL